MPVIKVNRSVLDCDGVIFRTIKADTLAVEMAATCSWQDKRKDQLVVEGPVNSPVTAPTMH